MFTVREICAIIKAGSTHGIATLKCGDLHIEFGRTPEPPTPQESEWVNPIKSNSEDEKSDAQLQKDELEKQEIRYREEQIAFSILEDPEFAERLLADGDLEDDDDDGSID